MLVLDKDLKIVQKNITLVWAFLSDIVELIVNARDHNYRDPNSD
jgi:hypothetical protein